MDFQLHRSGRDRRAQGFYIPRLVREIETDDTFLTGEYSSRVVSPSENYQWLYYIVDYHFKGNSKKQSNNGLFGPLVASGDYKFSDEFLTGFREESGEWYILWNNRGSFAKISNVIL